MANVRNSNTFYVDSASNSSLVGSFVNKKQIQVKAIIFTAGASGDSVVLADLNTAGTGAGSTKMTLKNNTANDAKLLSIQDSAFVFPNGIWVSSITSGATATLLLVDNGS